MNSLDHSGTPSDGTCCRAKAPVSACRCNVADRNAQYQHLLRLSPDRPKLDRHDLAEAVFRRELEILRKIVEMQDGFGLDSPELRLLHRVAEIICEPNHPPDVPSGPFTPEELANARRLDEIAGMPW
jgi:hypothetical protein